MERTPFDADAPLDNSLSDDAPADVETDVAGHDTEVTDETPAPTAPNAPRVPRWFWFALGAIVLALLLAGAGVWSAKRAESARLAELRERVSAIVRNDNALVLEVLGADESQTLTYAEFFERAAKNKSDRDTLIRKLRTLVASPYQTEVDNLVRLLEIENDYVRAEEAVARQKLEVAARREALQEIADSDAEARVGAGSLEAPYVAPSGADGGPPADVGAGAGAAFRKYRAAREAMGLKLSAATLAIDNWLQAEPNLYPQWAPPRNVADALQAKKRRYAITLPDPNADPDAPLNPDPDAPVSPDFAEPPTPEPVPTESPTQEPTPETEPGEAEPTEVSPDEASPDEEPTPEPTLEAQPTVPEDAAPTRDDAPDALPSERFSQTRLRAVTPGELRGLSDQELRYATNEMFARYGQTFGDKSYQAQFESAPWYRPNPNRSSAQIQRAFSDVEKSNLKLLIKERDRRKKSAGY